MVRGSPLTRLFKGRAVVLVHSEPYHQKGSLVFLLVLRDYPISRAENLSSPDNSVIFILTSKISVCEMEDLEWSDSSSL